MSAHFVRLWMLRPWINQPEKVVYGNPQSPDQERVYQPRIGGQGCLTTGPAGDQMTYR